MCHCHKRHSNRGNLPWVLRYAAVCGRHRVFLSEVQTTVCPLKMRRGTTENQCPTMEHPEHSAQIAVISGVQLWICKWRARFHNATWRRNNTIFGRSPACPPYGCQQAAAAFPQCGMQRIFMATSLSSDELAEPGKVPWILYRLPRRYLVRTG